MRRRAPIQPPLCRQRLSVHQRPVSTEIAAMTQQPAQPANQAAQPTGPAVPRAKSQGIMALLLGAGAVLCSRMRALSLVERL
jgi:hypothetical protein